MKPRLLAEGSAIRLEGPLLFLRRTVEVGLPFGAVDSLIGVSGGAKLSGWVIDPDTAGPIDVHVYVDGVGAAVTTANVTRPDVGALFPTAGSDHGFELTVPMSPGIHSVCTYAINVGGGRNPTIACRTVNVPSSNPFGRVDGVSAVPGGIRVVGWVLDPDSTGPVDVHLYLDGVGAKVITANLTRPDIAAAYPGYGPVHGFDTVVPSAVGWRSLCAYGINTGPGGNSTLGCRNVLVGGDPFGAVDAAIAGSGKIRVTGWAIDPDTGNPIDVHIYVDGAGVAITTANLTRADVGSAFTGYGDDHGFDVTVAAASGTRSVCAYAINTGSGTSNPLLGCRSARVL